MPAIQQPDFNNIFASAAALGEIINWPAEDYLEGWGYLNNNEPPPMEYFNAYFNGTDNKLLYLFESVNIRKNNTAYQIDDIITSPNLSSKFYLVCTQAGTTDANEPDYTNASINQEITDGTTKWLVVRKSGNMEAATAEADGKGGMVPAPKAGDEDSFLSGSATYVPIATQTEAEAQENQNNKKPMTPLRVYQAIVAYFTQFLAAAVFTGIVKAVAPAAASNDNSVPTTSWVRTCFESMAKTVAEILEIQWKTEATGYLLLGPYLGNLKILWGTSTTPANYTATVNYAISITTTWIALGIGIVGPSDNTAKVVSNVYTETTASSTKFRTEQTSAPSVRWLAVGW